MEGKKRYFRWYSVPARQYASSSSHLHTSSWHLFSAGPGRSGETEVRTETQRHMRIDGEAGQVIVCIYVTRHLITFH